MNLKQCQVFLPCTKVDLEKDKDGSFKYDCVCSFSLPNHHPDNSTGNPWPTFVVYRMIQGLHVQSPVSEEGRKYPLPFYYSQDLRKTLSQVHVTTKLSLLLQEKPLSSYKDHTRSRSDPPELSHDLQLSPTSQLLSF
ncbi:hypothetical protein TREES_T100005024 [Tupaia chinensis]|uniref:Uncharacterized protein n=1 Tax=Tupaia chinensis TaxID=246437 RepID=L9L529_TUPCH|nr:hypothetical protein TREES_T100005024 [Tupaia chinensis]